MSETDEIKHRHRILEAIDQLRRRKARPDVNRICSYMFRRFSVSCGETKADLQKLIEAEIVIKVDYKGNTSYRNAAKWAMLPNYKSKQELDSSNTSSILSSAVAELIVLEPDYLDIGVPTHELEKHLLKKDSRRFTKKNLETVLKREIDNGILVMLENGNYFLGEQKQNDTPTQSAKTNKPTISKTKTKKAVKQSKVVVINSTPDVVHVIDNRCLPEDNKEEQKEKMDDTNGASNSASSNNENVGFRVGGRQKVRKIRAKVMFDPSDNNLPKISRKKGSGRPSLNVIKSVPTVMRTTNGAVITAQQVPRPTVQVPPGLPPVVVSPPAHVNPLKASFNNVQQNPASALPLTPSSSVCCICHSYGLRTKGIPERLVNCTDCSNFKAHLSCIEAKKDAPGYKHKTTAWQCLDCTCCSVCHETGKVGKIAVCSLCGDAYHYICHSPHIPLNMMDMDKWGCAKCYSVHNMTTPTLPLMLQKAETVDSVIKNNVIKNEDLKANEEDFVEEIEDDEEEEMEEAVEEKSAVDAVSAQAQHTGSSNSISVVNSDKPSTNSSLPTVASTTTTTAVSTTLSSSSSSSSSGSVSSTTTTNCSTVTTDATSTTVKSTIKHSLATSNSGVSSVHTSSSGAPAIIDDVDDSKDDKPFSERLNECSRDNTKENIKKLFTIPLNNNNNNSSSNNNNYQRLSAYEKGLLPPACIQDPYDGYPIDESIPDATMWSPQDVFQYFVKYFDQDTARIFKDQEIDGQSLLLMKRADVLTGLCLKLGPALKVYSHVKKLQIRRSLPKLLWS